MKTILVPVDLSAATARICAVACDLARLVKGRIILLHVVAPPPVVMNEYYAFDAGGLSQAMMAAEKGATRKLRNLARRCARRCPVRTVQITGQPVRAIVTKAAATKAAYVVMGSHGHGAMFDLLVGSTAHGVMRKVRCPVIVVPTGRR